MITLNVKVKVKSSKTTDLPDWGAGPGILVSQEIQFDDTGLSPEQIAAGLNDVYHNLLKEVTEIVIEQVN